MFGVENEAREVPPRSNAKRVGVVTKMLAYRAVIASLHYWFVHRLLSIRINITAVSGALRSRPYRPIIVIID